MSCYPAFRSNPLAALERERGGVSSTQLTRSSSSVTRSPSQVVLRLLELAQAQDACSSSTWAETVGLLVIGAWEKAAPIGAGAETGTGTGATSHRCRNRMNSHTTARLYFAPPSVKLFFGFYILTF